MPYITTARREQLEPVVGSLKFTAAGCTAGDVNYLITTFVRAWIGDPNYLKIATATGVLENVKQELYRRLASPYEDRKIQENGDVY